MNNKTEEKIGFLFDLDGVLIDSETEYTRIWNEIDREFPTGVENFSIKIKGTTLPNILETYFQAGVHEEVKHMLDEKEQKMHYRMLPGATKLLRELQRKGLPRVLVTSSNEFKMKHLREEQPQLEGCFNDIVTADHITHSKPDPEGYLLGARLIGVSPRRCVVFEDSAQGIRAGHDAGAFVVGLTTTLPASAIEEYADVLIGNLSEVEIEKLIEILRNR